MAFVPNANVAMIEVVCSLLSQVCENVIYIDNPDGWSEATLLATAEDVGNWFAEQLLLYLSSQMTLIRVIATSLESAVAPSVVWMAAGGTVGGEVSTVLPSGVAYAIRFSTSGRGRSSRGRNFIYGLTTNNVSGDVVNVLYQGHYRDAYEGLNDALSYEGSRHVVYSRITDGVERAEGLSQPVLSYGFADQFVDRQWRRVPPHGS